MFLAVLTPKESGEVSHDAMLVHQLLQRDVDAFEQLYDRHSRIVYNHPPKQPRLQHRFYDTVIPNSSMLHGTFYLWEDVASRKKSIVTPHDEIPTLQSRSAACWSRGVLVK